MSYQSSKRQIIKKIAAFSMILTMIALTVPFGSFETVNAASYINSAGSTSGSKYTSSSALASKLDTVFAGDIGLSTTTSFKSTVNAKLGSSVMTGSRMYYIKNKTTGATTSGWQCFIYANAVYNTLFNEYVGRASGLKNSKVLISGGNTASYNQFSKAGVKCGAYMRTTTKSNGAYNGSAGHSLIVLSYNANNITYLEGNADGRGLVRIATRTWSDFNSNQLSGRSRYICHLVQPTDSYYNSLYSASSGSGSTAKTTSSTTTSSSTGTSSSKVSYSRVLSYKSSVMSGEDVKYVQNCLKTLGYTVNVNSKYDSTTQTAVKKFQKDYSLSVDGKCGSGTWAALEKAVAAKKNGTAATTTASNASSLKITQQPSSASAALGKKVSVAVKTSGTGLTYQWQYSSDGKNWTNSTIKSATYTVTLIKAYNNRKLRCVITDKYGNKVTSNVATIKIK